MPIGIILNALVIAAGGIAGALAGNKKHPTGKDIIADKQKRYSTNSVAVNRKVIHRIVRAGKYGRRSGSCDGTWIFGDSGCGSYRIQPEEEPSAL